MAGRACDNNTFQKMACVATTSENPACTPVLAHYAFLVNSSKTFETAPTAQGKHTNTVLMGVWAAVRVLRCKIAGATRLHRHRGLHIDSTSVRTSPFAKIAQSRKCVSTNTMPTNNHVD
jgi:hydroxyacyl-ACP dehydratase HTD2-like protein with hotdog domain